LVPHPGKCPASAAAWHAWHSLHLAVGQPLKTPVWSPDAPVEATQLAKLLGKSDAASRLLLELAVLIFTMGCQAGCQVSGHAVATALACEAALRLADEPNEGLADDAPLAARHVAKVLGAMVGPEPLAPAGKLSRAALLKQQEVTSATAEASDRGDAIASSRMRWKVVSYTPLDEVWILRRGRRREVRLPAAPPITWCFEGLALSEAVLGSLSSYE